MVKTWPMMLSGNQEFSFRILNCDPQTKLFQNRFMYNNKISTATVGGHGLGAKVALAAACYHTERFTGFFGVDYSPVNYRQYEPFRELVTYLNAVKNLNLSRPRGAITRQLDALIADPKWCEIFKQNLAMISPGNYRWNFDMQGLLENVNHHTMEHVGAWNSHYGIPIQTSAP